MSERRPLVGLLVTCLVDLFRPSVGFAAVRLLRAAGYEVVVPPQTCCGQPGFNAGHRDGAREIARQVIDSMSEVEYLVAPSASCAGMVKSYPELFVDDPPLRQRALELADQTWELTSFLTDVAGIERIAVSCPVSVCYHDSCSALRELGVKDQPRALLRSVGDLELRELERSEACCGFGGTFAVKYSAISADIADYKIADIERSGAQLLVSSDLGCLLHLAGRLKRVGSSIEVRHVAEILADMLDEPSIGEERG